jgi:peptidoglycan/LPS O-acetylase OafA/YrhL
MSTTESSRLAYVDALRLLAAGLVLFQHLVQRHPSWWSTPLVQLGPGVAGVVLFFLISGFVIPFSVRSGLHLRGFMIRRVMRIYPLFLVALAIIAIGGFTGWLAEWSDLRSAQPLRWIGNLLLVQDFFGIKPLLGVSWTLIIELAWYALFAAALVLFKARAALILAIAVPAGLLALAALSLALDTRIPLGRPAMIYAAVLGYQTYLYSSGALSARGLGAAIAAFLAVTWLTNYIAFGVFSHTRITLE